MDIILKYLELGLATQIYKAETNLLIWRSIAKKADKYELQDDTTKRLFHFLQQSARTNFILSTAKIFDSEKSRYPTRCIQSLLKLLSAKKDFPDIQNKTFTSRMIKDYGWPDKLQNAVNDPNLFAQEFTKYCWSKYNGTDIQEKINKVKHLRDKFIAHDENEAESINVELEIFSDLIEFATQILAILCSAYFSRIWTINGQSQISLDSERNSSFIHKVIDNMIKH